MQSKWAIVTVKYLTLYVQPINYQPNVLMYLYFLQ